MEATRHSPATTDHLVQPYNCSFFFRISRDLEDLQPMSMRQIVNIFSASVFGETFPNPTDVKPVIVKYTDVM